MSEQTALAILLAGVLLYKTLELLVVKFKVTQAYVRGSGSPAGSRAAGRLCARMVEWLERDFLTVAMIYFLATILLLGLFLIFAQGQNANSAFLGAKVLSAVTVLASIFIAMLNITVERYRTVLETS